MELSQLWSHCPYRATTGWKALNMSVPVRWHKMMSGLCTTVTLCLFGLFYHELSYFKFFKVTLAIAKTKSDTWLRFLLFFLYGVSIYIYFFYVLSAANLVMHLFSFSPVFCKQKNRNKNNNLLYNEKCVIGGTWEGILKGVVSQKQSLSIF